MQYSKSTLILHQYVIKLKLYIKHPKRSIIKYNILYTIFVLL